MTAREAKPNTAGSEYCRVEGRADLRAASQAQFAAKDFDTEQTGAGQRATALGRVGCNWLLASAVQ